MISAITDPAENPYVKNRFGFPPFSFEMVKAEKLKDRMVTQHTEYVDVRFDINLVHALAEDKAVIDSLTGALLLYEEPTQGEIVKHAQSPAGPKPPGINTLQNKLKHYSRDDLPLDRRLFLVQKGESNSRHYSLNPEYKGPG